MTIAETYAAIRDCNRPYHNLLHDPLSAAELHIYDLDAFRYNFEEYAIAEIGTSIKR